MLYYLYIETRGSIMKKHHLAYLILAILSASSMAETPTAQSNNVIIGNDANVKNSTTSISVGPNASAQGNSSVSEGYQAIAQGDAAVAIGVAATAVGDQSASFGSNANTHGNSSSSFGSGAIVKGIQAEAFGSTAHAIGNAAVAFGSGAQANGSYSTALGTNARSSTSNIAIGNYAHATGTRGSIAIGNQSQSTDGQVSFGNNRIQRRLEHVSAGIADTDAVNVSQLNKGIKTTENYTNTKVASTLTEAKTYSHQQSVSAIQQANTYTDNKAATTLTTANNYSQQQSVSAVKQANSYTNDKSATTLTTANKYSHQQSINAVQQANTYTNNKSAATLSAANEYTDQKVNLLTHDIQKVHDQANAGIASAMAMTSIPMRQGYHYTLGMGVANYGNQSAMAIGGKFDIGQHAIVTLAASDDSQHNSGIAAGVGFGF